MTLINEVDKFERDWDWFAVDPDGNVGHFTTAGIRSLPKTVRQDKEGALRLIDYFFTEALKSFPYEVGPAIEKDARRWANDSERSRYLHDFVQMASAGLFSYDTDITQIHDNYFLVAFPTNPLQVHQLPRDIRDLVNRTQSPVLFAKTPYIAEGDTCTW